MLGDLTIICLNRDGKMSAEARLDEVTLNYENNIALARDGNKVVASMQTFTDDPVVINGNVIHINVGIPLDGPGSSKEYCEWDFEIRKV